MIKNQKGYTLTELIAGIALTTLLFTGFTLFYIQFMKSLYEIREFNQLQDEMIFVIESIKKGYVKKNVNEKDKIIGLLTGDKVQIATNQSSVTITPIITNEGASYYATYSLNSKGQIQLQARYQFKGINDIIFPSSKEVIDKQLKYRVTEFKISNITPTGTQVKLVKIYLEAQVRFRQKGVNQSKADDERQNLKKISFESIAYIGNVKS